MMPNKRSARNRRDPDNFFLGFAKKPKAVVRLAGTGENGPVDSSYAIKE